MILSIHQAEFLEDVNMWLVYFFVPDESRFPIMRMIPADENPVSCPGGEIWCKEFGCIPGDNVFTRAKPEILLEEGYEIPKCKVEGCDLDIFECDHTEWEKGDLSNWKDRLV